MNEIKGKVFYSWDEIKRYYFPRAYEEERWAKMTPEERGRVIVQEIMNKARMEPINV